MDANSMLDPAPPDDPYLRLDDSVRMVVSRREWLWLSDREKATLEQDMCEPEPEN